MQSASDLLFPVESRPYGLTYGEWSAKWWQWLLSIPRANNPVFDNNGDNAHANQDNPNVFFLCQTVEGIQKGRTSQSRTIYLRAGKSIFMPIINWISVLNLDGQTDEELTTVAKRKMNVISELRVVIDGVTIEEELVRYRALSPFFNMKVPDDNIFQLPPGVRRFVADGYWIFLKPIEKSFSLTTFGSCSSGVNKFGINYVIKLL